MYVCTLAVRPERHSAAALHLDPDPRYRTLLFVVQMTDAATFHEGPNIDVVGRNTATLQGVAAISEGGGNHLTVADARLGRSGLLIKTHALGSSPQQSSTTWREAGRGRMRTGPIGLDHLSFADSAMFQLGWIEG